MIEQMTHVAILSTTAEKDALLRWLYGERGFHVMPIEEDGGDAWSKRFNTLPDDTQTYDIKLNRLNSVVGFCQEHASKKPSFLDAMLPLKVVGTGREIDNAVAKCDIDALFDQVAAMRSSIEESNERIARLQSKKATIEQFSFLGDDLPKLGDLKNVALEVVAVAGQGGNAFLMDERIADGRIAAEELLATQSHTYYALAAPASEKDTLKSLIDEHALHVIAIPKVEHGARQELMLLDNGILEEQGMLDEKKAEANRFADQWLRDASLAAGHFESEKNLAAARNGMFASSHLFITRGYIKTDRLPAFKRRLEETLPGATILSCEAPEGEDPPVSLKWNKWISPAGLLVKMYGLPLYNSIDPTPYVASLFFIFVGICLGDAAYGIALILAMLWLKRKYGDQKHLQDFFQCFVYCGAVAIVVGLLTGSFMGNLASMIPSMHWFARLQNSLKVIDPIADSQTALYIAVGIGVFTQFYGMALLVYRNWRRGDRMGAFSDGILWICFLAFVLIAGATGSAFFWWLFLAAVVGLVLTQGREQKNWIARILVGIVSLYGIVGSYGASAILGDLISYARLMALGLTSAALGSTFNLLADLSVGIPAIGLIIAVFVVIIGHMANFFLGLLGGFVHSARLIMLEFFGRFYESGGTAYKPYGFDSSTVGVKREKK